MPCILSPRYLSFSGRREDTVCNKSTITLTVKSSSRATIPFNWTANVDALPCMMYDVKLQKETFHVPLSGELHRILFNLSGQNLLCGPLSRGLISNTITFDCSLTMLPFSKISAIFWHQLLGDIWSLESAARNSRTMSESFLSCNTFPHWVTMVKQRIS